MIQTFNIVNPQNHMVSGSWTYVQKLSSSPTARTPFMNICKIHERSFFWSIARIMYNFIVISNTATYVTTLYAIHQDSWQEKTLWFTWLTSGWAKEHKITNLRWTTTWQWKIKTHKNQNHHKISLFERLPGLISSLPGNILHTSKSLAMTTYCFQNLE